MAVTSDAEEENEKVVWTKQCQLSSPHTAAIWKMRELIHVEQKL